MCKQPTVVVFDDEKSERLPEIKKLLGDGAHIKWFDYFSSESIGRGETAVFVWPEQLAKTRIDLLIIDLAVVRKTDPEDGIRVLRRLRQSLPDREIPAFVISDSEKLYDPKVRRQLKILGVPEGHIFFWPAVVKENELSERERFREEASKILGQELL
jgi:CheY-like chemotaxis protein